jgi:hypothetical protein
VPTHTGHRSHGGTPCTVGLTTQQTNTTFFNVH